MLISRSGNEGAGRGEPAHIQQTIEVLISRSGNEGAYLTFQAYPGETPVLDGTGLTGTGLEIGSNVSYVRVDGLVIQNFGGWGVAVAGGTTYIELLNLEVKDNGDSGVRLYG